MSHLITAVRSAFYRWSIGTLGSTIRRPRGTCFVRCPRAASTFSKSWCEEKEMGPMHYAHRAPLVTRREGTTTDGEKGETPPAGGLMRDSRLIDAECALQQSFR